MVVLTMIACACNLEALIARCSSNDSWIIFRISSGVSWETSSSSCGMSYSCQGVSSTPSVSILKIEDLGVSGMNSLLIMFRCPCCRCDGLSKMEADGLGVGAFAGVRPVSSDTLMTGELGGPRSFRFRARRERWTVPA